MANSDEPSSLLSKLEVIVTLVQCVANGRSKDDEDYRKVLSMVNEIQPRLRVIGVDGYDELYRMLLSYMSKCALFLVGEHDANFDQNLTYKFFVETFSEYKRSFLNESIQFLSEAISTMSDMYKKKNNKQCASVNLLAMAYCLRALSSQEAEPNLKCKQLFVQDIGCALKLWLNQDHSQSIKHTDAASHNTLILLYHVGDLLSLKGNMEFHSDIYELIIRFFTCKKVSMKECVAKLWQAKRLSHALCTSHVDDAFILTFSKHCKLSQSLDFWKSCMKKSKSLEVGFQQCFSVISTLSSPSTCNHDHAEYAHLMVDDIKKCARDLSSTCIGVPLTNKLSFLSANLYYDLTEMMILKGSIIEALSSGKEAQRLCVELFQEYFTWSSEIQKEIIGDNGEIIQKQEHRLKSFHLHSSVVTACSYDKDSSDIACILTPWNVLRCYLESTLQVGTIYEILGDGFEAETLLRKGKEISSFQGLPVFLVAFSIALGKVYRKQHHWHLAEKELESAKAILFDSSSHISCLKCKLVLEVTVNQQLGDLFRSRFNSKDDNRYKGLTKSELFYRSATEKLMLSEWKNCVSNPKETSSRNTMFCDSVLNDGNNVVIDLKQRHKSKVDCIGFCGSDVKCGFDEINCWHCVPFGVIKSSSLTSVIQMKWECIRRRLLVKLLTGTGKCLLACSDTDGALKVFLESISVLVNRSTFHPSKFKISFTFLADLINKNVISDAFAIEHASLLYNICWFSLRSSCGNGTRNHSCEIPIPVVVSALKLSFIVAREVPELFQKISRLLAVLYTLSPSNKAFSMFTSDNTSLSESKWASYFHQASVGTPGNYQFPYLVKQTNVHGSFSSRKTSLSFPRPTPKSVMDLEEFILEYFQGLPQATIICLSMLGDDYVSWLRDLLPYKPHTHDWVMFSRLNSDCAPIVVVLPIDSILAGSSKDNEDSSSNILSDTHRPYVCPWGPTTTVVDEIAPMLRTILEKLHVLFIKGGALGRIKGREKQNLDRSLCDLLRDIENLWFGPWIHLLSGAVLDHKQIDFLPKKLMKDLKSKFKIDVDEDIIKAVIRGGGQQKECLSELIVKKGCYIGGRECLGAGSLSSLVSEALLNEIGQEYSVDREPVILVTEFDLHGTSCTLPSEDELRTALEGHDLFIYLGHGNGLQYFPGSKIQELDRCAAALLMGCCSGSLWLQGSYIPKGAPLCYLSAGSPIIIATLWDTHLSEIESFGKALFDGWINAGYCSQCTRKMNIVTERKTKGGGRITKRKYCEVDSRTPVCEHMPKIGFYVGQARRECVLPFLTGAGIVCYGLPTGLRRKDL